MVYWISNMKTSLELSKKLKDNGFGDGENKGWWWIEDGQGTNNMRLLHSSVIGANNSAQVQKYHMIRRAKAYDILNDLCVKYAKEMFGEEEWLCPKCGCTKWERPWEDGTCTKCGEFSNITNTGHKECSEMILWYLKKGEQQEAEDYLLENCKFNNKKT